MSDLISVSMLGTFSLSRGGLRMDDSSNRMRKVWLLLAYLIYNRHRRVTQDNYLTLTQGNDTTQADDPSGRLKALFYRARTMLDQLGPNSGHELIIRKGGSYAWNTELPIRLDVEEFDRLCTEAAALTGDARLERYLEALSLYQGDFLPKLSSEAWVMPISTYFHQRFLDAAAAVLPLLEERGRWTEVTSLCRRALKIEPYSEELYQHLMRGQIASGDQAGAVSTYETMNELLFDTFGVMPSDDSRKLYREASRESNSHAMSADMVRDSLREPGSAKGAVFCEYDFFQLLYQIQARSIVRSGDVVHIALLSLHGADSKPLTRRSLDRAMNNLQELILSNLRQGDVVTRCSACQMIVMLPQANYETSCMLCRRTSNAFSRQYPHSPAVLHFSVHPLEPVSPGTQNETD